MLDLTQRFVYSVSRYTKGNFLSSQNQDMSGFVADDSLLVDSSDIVPRSRHDTGDQALALF
jgi:hypothetical protein